MKGHEPIKTQEAPRRSGTGPRWWPLGLLVILTLARVVQLWWFKDYERQFKFSAMGQWLLIAIPAALLWFLLLSRIRLRTRLAGLAVLILSLAILASSLRMHGISGDALPVLEWRWSDVGRPPKLTGDANVLVTSTNARPSQADYPQFQGPDRDGRLPDCRPATNWASSPPRELWRVPVGEGWSGFAVSGPRAVSLEQAGDEEVVFALEASTGRRLWASSYPARYANPEAGNGPRSVPTIVGDAVYTAGATGVIGCWDLRTGRKVWQVDLVRELGAKVPAWGYSASPLVRQGLVWIPAGAPGRSLVALDGLTGKLRLAGGDSPTAYSSPIAARLGGRNQILCLNEVGLAGHDATDGSLLWEQPIPPAPHVAAPAVLGPDRVLVSVGYGKGTFLVGVGQDASGGWTNGVIWRSIRLKSKFSNIIPDGNTLYGLDDGALVALDLATGSLLWKGRRYGHGQLMRAGDGFVVGAENGEVSLVEGRPDGMTELGRFRALTFKTWNPPALAGDLLLIRNDREAAGFRINLEKATGSAGGAGSGHQQGLGSDVRFIRQVRFQPASCSGPSARPPALSVPSADRWTPDSGLRDAG